jgi:phosphopantetheine adenylyltransferase
MKQYNHIRKHFEKFLEDLFEDRKHLDNSYNLKDEDGFPISQVVAYERERLFEEINRIREKEGLSPIEKKQVNQADTLATGHIDFYSKLCTYSAELTMNGKLHESSYW